MGDWLAHCIMNTVLLLASVRSWSSEVSFRAVPFGRGEAALGQQQSPGTEEASVVCFPKPGINLAVSLESSELSTEGLMTYA